jgi:hypothetical protein
MIINNIRLILCKIKFLKDITQNSGKGRENFRHREGEREGQRDSDEERERIDCAKIMRIFMQTPFLSNEGL